MPNNIPTDLKDCNSNYEVIVDRDGHFLTHYMLAERLMQVEAAQIFKERAEDGTSDTLTYILEGGFRGFHKYKLQEMRDEWLDGAEEKWFNLYHDKELPWETYEEDPICQKK